MSQDKQFYTTFFTIMGGLVVLMIVLIIIATNLTSEVAEYQPDDIVKENIKPVGRVNIAGEYDPDPMPGTGDIPELETAAKEPRSGEEIYKSKCLACHAAGVAGAPKLGDTAAWAPRIAAGMDSLMANATNGLNAMPPMGTCASCSGEELRAAVEYMVDKSR